MKMKLVYIHWKLGIYWLIAFLGENIKNYWVSKCVFRVYFEFVFDEVEDYSGELILMKPQWTPKSGRWGNYALS